MTACAAVCLGYDYREVVAPSGITLRSNWLGFGLRSSAEHAELDASVDDLLPLGER